MPGIQPAPWDGGRVSLSGGEGCTLFLSSCSPASLPTPCCILPFIPSRRINLQFLFCLSPSPLLPVSHAQDLLLIYQDSFSFFHVFSGKKKKFSAGKWGWGEAFKRRAEFCAARTKRWLGSCSSCECFLPKLTDVLK